jgi:hypothetical protein
LKEDCIFIYGAVTLYGRPFQTVLLTLSYPSFNQAVPHGEAGKPASYETLPDYCGPATPDFPCESSGLGCSEFARHYYRNHGCFLFLGVLRWFTSPRSLHTTMNSSHDSRCSHRLGSPIRKSPDHGLLASPRGLSQLATSFIAYLRQGIHTHALSSLTIKFTLDTEYCQQTTGLKPVPLTRYRPPYIGCTAAFCNFVVARQYSIVKDLAERRASPPPTEIGSVGGPG